VVYRAIEIRTKPVATDITISSISNFTTGDGAGPAMEKAIGTIKNRVKGPVDLKTKNDELRTIYIQFRAASDVATTVLRVGRYSSKTCAINVVSEVNQKLFLDKDAAVDLLKTSILQALPKITERLNKNGIAVDFGDLDRRLSGNTR
jgi:hypothetical protein